MDPFSAFPYDVQREFGGTQTESETRLLAPNAAASSEGVVSRAESDLPEDERQAAGLGDSPASTVRAGVTWGVIDEPAESSQRSNDISGVAATVTTDIPGALARTDPPGTAPATSDNRLRTASPSNRGGSDLTPAGKPSPSSRGGSGLAPARKSSSARSRRAANGAGAGRAPSALDTVDSSGLLPEPRPWAAAFIQAAMEVACGLRPSTQLVRWTTPDVHGALVRRGALTARAMRNSAGLSVKPRLRALVLCSPRPGVCEVSAVIAEPQRVRAVAFRMEGLHGRWRVTELQMQGRLES
ncbi:Rv3235 family protein [Kineosporia rhizophila]|nr:MULTISPECIES: Rv3235 family protein [Kineosporia]MCE0534845.1 Rv3235 family protein [Kineosporia rhizophila]